MSKAKIKINIEDAGNYLDPERTSAMMDLVGFLRANKIGIQHSSGASWSLRYKGRNLGQINIYNGTWRFAHRGLDKYYQMEDGDLKSFIFDNIYARECGDCQWNQNAAKVKYMEPTTCGCWPLRIFNAGGEVLENTKRLIEFRMNCILEDLK